MAQTFPDTRWGSEDGFLRRPLVAFASTKVGSWTIRTLTPVDRTLLQRTRGRYTVLGPIGAPTLLLTTTGRKSRQPRTTPLLYARDGDRLVVTGSNFGQEHHPAWTANLLADPHATVGMAGRTIPVRAELATGADADRLYRKMVDVASVYDVYRDRTGRDIRVFTLTAV